MSSVNELVVKSLQLIRHAWRTGLWLIAGLCDETGVAHGAAGAGPSHKISAELRLKILRRTGVFCILGGGAKSPCWRPCPVPAMQIVGKGSRFCAGDILHVAWRSSRPMVAPGRRVEGSSGMCGVLPQEMDNGGITTPEHCDS